MTKICPDKGNHLIGCPDLFKKKFNQLWNRAFSSITTVNGMEPDRTGDVTIRATDILIPGENITITNDVISSTPHEWGHITGELTAQTDLNDRFDAIEDDIGNTSDPDTIKGKIAVNTGDIEALESDVDTLETTIVTKQDILIAGIGIEIANNVISADTAFHAQVFNSLPTASELYKNTIALIIISGTQTYKQYACTTEDEGVSWSWKEVGTTQVDLSAYKVWTQTQAYIDSADSLKADSSRIPTIVRVGYE